MTKWDYCSTVIEITNEEREAQRSQDTRHHHHTWLKIQLIFYQFTILGTCCFKTSGASPGISEAHSEHGGQGETEEAHHSRLGGGGFNKTRNLFRGLPWAATRCIDLYIGP